MKAVGENTTVSGTRKGLEFVVAFLLRCCIYLALHSDTSDGFLPIKTTTTRNDIRSSDFGKAKDGSLSWGKHVFPGEMVNGKPHYRLVDATTARVNNTSYDLAIPRDWLEYWEARYGKSGAYTVIRADYNHSGDEWRIWGKGFHMRRLLKSFVCLDELSTIDPSTLPSSTLDPYQNRTETTIQILLRETRKKILSIPSAVSPHGVVPAMLTILWLPNRPCTEVLGHVSTTFVAQNYLEYDPSLIEASVAVSKFSDSTLPNRFDNFPQAKLSSWVRERRPLELEFKCEGINEVILTKDVEEGETVELLEGLTSNIFFVYEGRMLRTAAADMVLGGYARQLIIAYARGANFTVQELNVPLQESDRWQEVFLTMSTKIIAPVKQLSVFQMQEDGTRQRKVVWPTKSNLSENRTSEPVWRELYDYVWSVSEQNERLVEDVNIEDAPVTF